MIFKYKSFEKNKYMLGKIYHIFGGAEFIHMYKIIKPYI